MGYDPGEFRRLKKMDIMKLPKAVSELIDELKVLPAIGPRSAERIAVWMLTNAKRNPVSLAEALIKCEQEVSFCKDCGYFSQGGELCEVCTSPRRQRHLICVVEKAPDVIVLERSQAFTGLYHCLGGVLSPLDNVHPEDLKIASLKRRVEAFEDGGEVILALNASVEGEATCNYLESLLSSETVKVTRLARGLPVGAHLEYADQLTLERAFEGRKRAF